MKPHPISLISAVLLYVLLALLGAVAVVAVQWLIDVGRDSPRLAALGWLALLLSPAYSVAILHHIVHKVLDSLDPARRKHKTGILPSLESWYAGVYGWLVTVMSTMVATIVMAILFPPDRDEGFAQMLLAATPHNVGVSIHTLVWILVATGLYQLERAARASLVRHSNDS
jgi:hypothetical protein